MSHDAKIIAVLGALMASAVVLMVLARVFVEWVLPADSAHTMETMSFVVRFAVSSVVFGASLLWGAAVFYVVVRVIWHSLS